MNNHPTYPSRKLEIGPSNNQPVPEWKPPMVVDQGEVIAFYRYLVKDPKANGTATEATLHEAMQIAIEVAGLSKAGKAFVECQMKMRIPVVYRKQEDEEIVSMGTIEKEVLLHDDFPIRVDFPAVESLETCLQKLMNHTK